MRKLLRREGVIPSVGAALLAQGEGGPGTRGAWGRAKVNCDSFPPLTSQLLPELVQEGVPDNKEHWRMC